MDYAVAIPSYRRIDGLANKTLPLLLRGGVPTRALHFFLDEEEIDRYRKYLPSDATFHTCGRDICAVRNDIVRAFPEGARVVSVDDDIEALVCAVDRKRPFAQLADIDGFIRLAFEVCDSVGLGMWGIYPVGAPNPYFMRQEVTFDLRVIVAAFMGFVNRHDDVGLVDVPDKEEVQRTIKRYVAEGGVVRFSCIAPVTRYYENEGGLSTWRSRARNDACARALVARYPDYCSLSHRGHRGYAEVVLRDVRRGRSAMVDRLPVLVGRDGSIRVPGYGRASDEEGVRQSKQTESRSIG